MADVVDAVKPTLVISRLIGLAPYTLDSEQRRLKNSKVGLFYSIVILLIYTAGSSFVLYEMIFGEKTDPKLYINRANRICQLACGVGVTIVTLLFTIIQRNRMAAVVHGIQQIDRDMLKLKISVSYESIIKFSLYENITLYICLFLLLIHDALVRYDVDNAMEIFVWICSFTSNFYNFTMESQFVSGALLLKKHFTILNDYLTKFNDLPDEDSGKVKHLTESYVEGMEAFLGPRMVDPKLIPWDGNFTRLHTAKQAVTANKEADTQLSKIKTFRKLHSNLCDVKETLNTAFSLQLLCSVAQAFVIITSDLYMLFTTISDPTPSQIGIISYPIVWSVTHVLELIFVVITCTKTSKKANQTAVVVHKLLARDCDQDIRNQLKLFSIQLLHRKISFSACGFFTLDMTLLQAIIGAATTYLVILIQFHNTYESNAPATTATTTIQP